MDRKMIVSISMLAASVSARIVIPTEAHVAGYSAYKYKKFPDPFENVVGTILEVHKSWEMNEKLSLPGCAKKCTEAGTRCNVVKYKYTFEGPETTTTTTTTTENGAKDDFVPRPHVAFEPKVYYECTLYALADEQVERLKSSDPTSVKPVPAPKKGDPIPEPIVLPAFLIKDPSSGAPLEDAVPLRSDAPQTQKSEEKEKSSAGGKGLTLAYVLGFFM